MKKVLFGAALAMATMVAHAGNSQDIESSAVVQGSLVLAPDGTVRDATITDPAKYGQAISDMVRKAALQWRFEPVVRDGAPVVARSSMRVRVVLKKNPDGNYTARIKGATFGDDDPGDTEVVRATEANKKLYPHYPEAAIRARVQGTVYLALHVDRNGRVTDAVAEQVNLDNTGSALTLNRYRGVLAKSALDVARKWTYQVPTTGKLARQDSWTVHLPVRYYLNALGAPPRDRTWETYVPGPYTRAPWVDKPDVNAADALADDAVQTDGAGPVLLSPLNHG